MVELEGLDMIMQLPAQLWSWPTLNEMDIEKDKRDRDNVGCHAERSREGVNMKEEKEGAAWERADGEVKR